jgi:uncharacterized membrane protein YoaK (UPF0700 family)
MSKNSMTVLAVSGCAGWGAVIWLASSYMTGKQEPWDAHSLVYPLSLFVAGFIGAALIPHRFWLAAVAVWAGQTVGFLWSVFTSSEFWRIVALRFGNRLAAVFASKSVWSVPWLAGRHGDS